MPLNRTAKEICTKFIRNAILHSSFAISVTRIGLVFLKSGTAVLFGTLGFTILDKHSIRFFLARTFVPSEPHKQKENFN